MKHIGDNLRRLMVLAVLMGVGLCAQEVAEEPDVPAAEESVAEVEEAVFVGTRRRDRSVAESPVPVDVINEEDLSAQGYVDMNALLSTKVPSYNVNTQPISDAATLVRPASLRGLSSDSTLVLVNGKRRHRASVITFLGGGIADGAQGPDLAAIPFIALKTVEVLRDGASAQYGSDAVAGILNFVLKDDDHGGRVETRWGSHYEGDGTSYTVAANVGMQLRRGGEPNGFANFSVEYTEGQATVRSVQRTDAQGLIDAGQGHISPHIRTPYAQVWGAPDVEYDYKFFGNAGMDLTDSVQLYFFPSFAKRKVEGGFYYRNPTNRGGVNRGIPGKTIKVADLRESPDPDSVPVVRLIEVNGALVPDPVALQEVEDNPDFFTFNEKFPGGFTPKFGGVITDMSLAGGLRGDLENGWHYDASAVIGHHRSEFYMRNTINPQLIAHPHFSENPASIPTSYRPGIYAETDYVINFDVSRPIELDMFHSPLNFAAGLEYRVEEFEIKAGEEYAWWVDKREGGIAQQGFGVGSNGFPAFPPSIAGVTDRGSAAGYLDIEADVVEDVLLGAAVRYENFEGGIGDTVNGKLAVRWQATEKVALRGSVSTGFRAPTLGQASVRNVTTAFAPLPGGGIGLADVATLPVNALPQGVFEGLRPLEPESSVNFSVGAVVSFNKLDITLDYYRIAVEDRIATTSFFPWPVDDAAGNPVPNPNNYSSVRWFSNDFDTTTQGIDVVASYPVMFDGGQSTLTLAFNLNETSVDRAGRYVGKQRIDQLENNLPSVRFTLDATHYIGPWTFILPRLRYYGEFVEYTADSWYGEFGAKVLVDAEVSHAFDSGLTLSVGAQNLFDTYPDSPSPLAVAGVGAAYAESSPYGFNGGFYYFRATYHF